VLQLIWVLAETEGMKLFVYTMILLLGALSASAAEECSQRADLFAFQPLKEFVQRSCEDTKASKECQDLYAQLKVHGEDPEEKGLQCTSKNFIRRAVEFQIDFRLGCAQGGWRYAMETLRSMGEGLVYGMEMARAQERMANCDKDLAIKQSFYSDYNASVPKMLQINIPKDEVLQGLDCERLQRLMFLSQSRQRLKAMNQVRTRLDDPKSTYTVEEQEYVTWLNKVKSEESGEKAPSYLAQAKANLVKLGVRLECYNTREMAAMLCESIADVATTAAGPAGAAMKIARSQRILKLAGLLKK